MRKIAKKDILLGIGIATLIPARFAHAEVTIGSIIENATAIVGSIVPLIIGLALVFYIYGLAQYILESGDVSKVAEGRNRMVWGTIAMFVIISVWGLVALLQATVFTGGVNNISPPQPKLGGSR